MKILDRFTKLFDRKGHISDTRVAIARKTDQSGFGGYFTSVVQRAGVSTSYANLTEEIIRRLPSKQVRDLIRKSNPIVAKAQADFADSVGSGFTYTADRTVEDSSGTPGQILLDNFVRNMESRGNGLDIKIEELARDMFGHGAAFAELVFDRDGRTPLDIKTLSSTTAVFRKRIDPVEGEYYELGQDFKFGLGNQQQQPIAQSAYYGGSLGGVNFVSLHDNPTIQYKPIQSEPNNPYGTPIIDPAVFNVIMMAGFMTSFQSALKGHVFPNLLITIDKEKFQKVSGLARGSKEIEGKFNAAIADIQNTIDKLDPGGALIHGDEVSLGGTLSNTGRSPLGSIEEIRNVIHRDLIIAVQSQPLFIGANDNVTETHAIEQRKAYGRLIRRSQNPINSMFTGYFNLILMANGLPPTAQFTLYYENTAEIRDQALTYLDFHQGLQVQGQSRKTLLDWLERAVESGYMTQAEAQARWDRRDIIENELDIIPKNF